MMREEDRELLTAGISAFARELDLENVGWDLVEGDPSRALFVVSHVHMGGRPRRSLRVWIPVGMIEDLRRYATLMIDGAPCAWFPAVRRARALLRFWPTPSYPR